MSVFSIKIYIMIELELVIFQKLLKDNYEVF